MALAAIAIATPGCKRRKPLAFQHVWLGAFGGCAETKAGELACWGGPAHAAPHVVDKTAPKQVVVAERRACGLWGDAVKCWTADTPPAAFGGNAVSIAYGMGDQICTISPERTLACRRLEVMQRPTEPFPGARVDAVALGALHMCAAFESPREVRCTGSNARGQTGDGKPLLAGETVHAMTAGDEHTCARTDRGLYCWGRNDAGQLGDGTTNDAHAPVIVHGIDAVELAAGSRHTCARLANNTMACWGANDLYQLANGTTTPSAKPVSVFGLVGVSQIAVAGDSACALVSEGSVRCWGKNDMAQLGDGTTETRNVPSSIKPWPR